MADSNDGEESKFIMMAEVLPDNERTAEIMKKRNELAEQKRLKMEELKALREQEEKKKRAKERNEA